MKDFNELLRIYKNYELAEPNFDDRIKNQRHQTFWEIWFSCFLLEKGIKLRKEGGGFEYYTEYNTQRIWFECVAPQKGNDKNEVMGISRFEDEDDFESGCLTDENKMKMKLRITQCIVAKLEQRQRAVNNGIMHGDDYCVLAINTFEAFQGWNIIPSVTEEMLCACLFKTGQLVINQQRGISLEKNVDLQKKSSLIKNDYLYDEQFPFSAVVYSDVSEHSQNNGVKYILNPRADSLLMEFMGKFFKS